MGSLLLSRETVELKVLALIVEAASVSFTSVGLTLGEAGWKRVGGRSSGNPVAC